ncbi:uncharacterized protein LOC143376299 isoform X2 [Andrena cerasifolii]|uniref:uncharacterized protein LOC143376299 isoform X2 n=1 Tax=Andrena cerasifolii TaxID=2819439 RepID=UPI0040382225
MEQVFATATKLSEVIQGMQKCLQCSICLHTISKPVKTRCNHRFCHDCIQSVLQNKNACPLCNFKLVRRSISKDEHMEQYIDKLENLMNAIQKDSGIDITLDIPRPRSTHESCSSDATDHHKLNPEAAIGPSCSNVSAIASTTRRNSSATAKTRRKQSKKAKAVKDSSRASTITKYLNKHPFSGVEALPPDESTDRQAAKSVRVQNWLETLPTHEVFDDPNKVAPSLAIDSYLDDTLAYSISQNGKDGKPDMLDHAAVSKLGDPANDNDDDHHRELAHNRTKGSWIRKDTENGALEGGSRQNSKGVGARVQSVVVDHQKPSTSGFTRPRNERKERTAQDDIQSHEKTSDIHKTSPCNMLPSMKHNWSSVARFGKEMRPRRKKLKSLDVSIENKGKPRSLDEPVTGRAVRSRAIKGTSEGKQSECNTSESIEGGRGDEHAFEERLPNVEGARSREHRLAEEASARNKGDRSILKRTQPAKESSFIMLDEGKQVHIKDLKSYQMNDIIGVVSSTSDCLEREIESVQGNLVPKGATLSVVERETLPGAQDGSETPIPATPLKDTVRRSSARGNEPEESSHDRTSPFLANWNTCSSGGKRIDETTDSAFKYQSPMMSPTTSRSRLSLKRRSSDLKSDEAQSVGGISRLFAVKRDLNREMDKSKREMGAEAGDGGLTSKMSSKRDGNGGGEGKDVGGPSADSRGASISNKRPNKREQSKGEARHVVAFKKLGRVVKYCRTPIRFLYLGTTRRSMLPRRDVSVTSFAKSCNAIDSSDLFVQMDPQRLCTTETRFGNNTRITVNDTMAIEQRDTQTNIQNKKEAEAMTRDKLDADMGQSVSDQPGPSTSVRLTTKRVGMYKDTAHKDITPVINSAASKSQESDDVFLVSLYDEQASVKRDRPINPSATDKTASRSTIRMLSPKKDSQLKFLSVESPTSDDTTVTKFDQQAGAAKDTSAKRSSFSDIRGAHSRALIRSSQQASGRSTSDSSSTPKRKRSISREKLGHRMKRKSKNEEGSPMKDGHLNSSHSLASKSTVIRKDINENDNTSKVCYTLSSDPTPHDIDMASVCSDTEVGPTATEKRAYRRIITVASSDTDSPDVFYLDSNKNTQPDAAPSAQIVVASPLPKRKRAESLDSDDDEDVNVIVSSWSKPLNPAESSTKKGKPKQTRASSVFQKTSTSPKSQKSFSSASDWLTQTNRMSFVQHRHQPEIATNSEGSGKRDAQRQTLAIKGVFDDDSPDFGATIDRIRGFDVVASVNDRDSDGKQKGASFMHDNFDEVMANVNTQVLIGEFSGGKESKSEAMKSAVPRPRSSNVDSSTSRQSDGSNKENKYQNAGMVCDVESDDEETLTTAYVNVNNRCSRKDKSLDRLKPFESTAKGSVSNGSLASKPVHESGKPIPRQEMGNGEEGSKDETCYEYDSLMDVTQHSLLIKQFEQDLFGRPLTYGVPSEQQKHAREQRTPQKQKTNDARPSDSKGKDAEHSGEEDGIVENTPEIKTRNITSIQTIGSNSKGSSISTPVSRMNGKQFARTPSTAGKSLSSTASPLSKTTIRPVYQSTPKAQAVVKGNGGANTCTEGEKPDLVANGRECLNKQANLAIGESAQSVDRIQLCFVCSGLLASQVERVKRLAQAVNARYVTQFEQGVSHVIVKVNEEDNGASKTLKYLQGIAYRKWIVGYQWVVDSLHEKKLLNEERYEAVDCRTLLAGPRNSRLRGKGLFEGFVILCKGPYEDVSVEQYKELLRATGAIVVDSLDALAAEKRRLKIIVIQTNTHNDAIIGWYQKVRAVPIVHDWVVECISQYKLISFYPYLQELSRVDVLSLGYPEFLVEEEPDEDFDNICDAST